MLAKLQLLVAGVTGVVVNDIAGLDAGQSILSLFQHEDLKNVSHAGVESAFLSVYNELASEFPAKQYESFLKLLERDLATYRQSAAYNGYRTVDAETCPTAGGATGMANVGGMAAYPGGIVRRTHGFDIAKLAYDLASKATGPASASAAMLPVLSAVALQQGAGTIQALVHTALSIVPPTVAPPAWNNQPLTCMPMVTGHNCFGAVLYPITAADFAIADVTDAALDGVIAGFPALYRKKVGKTSDAAYRSCFSAYMSMKCASRFPRCATPQATQAPMAGKLGMCFTHCVQTMVACPGFWIEDLRDDCDNSVSVPPQCAFSLFTNTWRAPPQYETFDEASDQQLSCPGMDASQFGDAASTGGAAGAPTAPHRLP